MFRILRYCKSGLIAGLIGMMAGMVGQIYIYEFSDRSAVLMQAATVFMDLDELSFLVAFAAAWVFLYFCVVLEYRRWSRRKKRNEAVKKI
jgi:tryptophan-rich sensory protein